MKNDPQPSQFAEYRSDLIREVMADYHYGRQRGESTVRQVDEPGRQASTIDQPRAQITSSPKL